MEAMELERLRQLLLRDLELTTTPHPGGLADPAAFFAAREHMLPLLEALTGRRLGPHACLRLIMRSADGGGDTLVDVFTSGARNDGVQITSINYSRHFTV